MRLAKNNMASGVLLRYENARCWMNPLAAFGVLTRLYLRKIASSKTEEFLGVRVYCIESKMDLSPGWPLLRGVAPLLKKTSPFWAKQSQNVFTSIIIHDRAYGPNYRYFHADRCWVVNPFVFSSGSADEKIIMLAITVLTYLCTRLLHQGRFGYFGVKNSKSISLSAIARFLRKCDSNRDCSKYLSWCYHEIDKVRPGRRYYERFMLEESSKGVPDL
jgi:hypothetical protein